MADIPDAPKTDGLPKRNRADTARLASVSGVMAVVAALIAAFTLPYRFDGPSPILEKAEIRDRIRNYRLDHKHWPKSESEAGFRFGPLATADQEHPGFSLQSVAMEHKTKNDKPVEAAYYHIRVRGDDRVHRISLEEDKRAKPRR